ncbi:MAG: hypothetical protein LBQ59_00225 [Candidatus Peribacteria bacterium]|jgi:hypothetical protein|nr:hypothetical protein [Candidatus Peribacteria bacterium]
MFKEIELKDSQIEAIFSFIKFGEENNNEEILSRFLQIDNKLLKEGIVELKEVYEWLLNV